MNNDVIIIADDINFETVYLQYYFADTGDKSVFEVIAKFIKNDMMERYDADIVFKDKYQHYYIDKDRGKMMLKYRDCTCMLFDDKFYLTKEIFFRKLKKF
jgi:hypothetical protein